MVRGGSDLLGAGRNRSGREGEDLVIEVPLGSEVLMWVMGGKEGGDLLAVGDRIQVAHGGAGGRGNKSFSTATIQTPRIAEAGELGEVRELKLDYKVVADIAVLGLPNVGKSAVLNALAGVGLKVADYPLTTVTPQVGIFEQNWRQYRVVEIPSTWCSAGSGNRKAGRQMLKHAERAKVLLLCLDLTSESVVKDYSAVATALVQHGRGLADKPWVVVLNKVDRCSDKATIPELKREGSSMADPCYSVSSVTGEGLDGLVNALVTALEKSGPPEKNPRKPSIATWKPRPRYDRAVVERQGDVFVVRSPRVERLVAGTDVSDWEARTQLAIYMERAGVQQALEKAGVKPGDTVRIGGKELEWA